MPPTALQPQILDVRSDAHPWWRRDEEAPGAAGGVVIAAGVPRQRGPLPIGREEKARPATLPAPRAARTEGGGAARDTRPAHRPRPGASPGRAGADVLRILADPRTPVFVTEHAGGRRVYGYWRPLDADSGRGGCYVALSATECDELFAAGRITVGDPVTDPTKTTYRVRAARTQPAGAQPAGARPAAAPVRTTAARGRAA
ncbi:cell envelope biogenesis protein OmpA [Streptomyces sp. NPDC002755]|uniref:cell envelope biogenesis protein OmpA n=1 Tax=Streptomyces sp. NPDC002884 TaxID=3154544 RepID=UPI00332AB5A4